MAAPSPSGWRRDKPSSSSEELLVAGLKVGAPLLSRRPYLPPTKRDLSGLQDIANDFEQVDSRVEELEVRITSILYSRKSSSNPKNQTVESIKNEVRLPEIPLPTFSGAFSEWESFKTQFTTLVSNNDYLDDNQKLFYLRASLKGEAKQLESTEDAFNSLFDALKERFENQRLLIDFHVLSILHYDKIQQESAREFRSLIDCIKKNIRGLKVLNYEQNNLSEILLVNIILQKLDTESRRQFEFSLKSSEVPQFDSLMSFLERRSSILESISRIPAAVKTTFPVKNAARNNSLNNPIKQKSLMIKSNNKRNFKACICCNNFHPLYKCISFKNMSVEKRKEFVSAYRVCELCLRKHAGSCSSRFKCFVKGCQMAHNTLLLLQLPPQKIIMIFRLRKRGSDGLEQSYSLVVRKGKVYSSLSLAQSSEICILLTALICFKYALEERILIRCLIDSGSQVCAIASECSDMLGMKKEKINIPVSGLNGTNIALKRKMEVEISNLENDFVRCVPLYSFIYHKFSSIYTIKCRHF
ncbi:hypothetical protein AVEN_66596-1 [Araneus ventricosus]|uniref:Peptidase aspartic putative domain-containing protein n=1 Tax=Araneus ventricosus TaxID=182803 RepID=A0A4Y2M2A8_ARAVE|nr:hypothetical protein AVEN_66596-1 [Araneus ventricosus]